VNDRYGSKPEVDGNLSHVRFAPESRRKSAEWLLSLIILIVGNVAAAYSSKAEAAWLKNKD
jgi:hypothetical protein